MLMKHCEIRSPLCVRKNHYIRRLGTENKDCENLIFIIDKL